MNPSLKLPEPYSATQDHSPAIPHLDVLMARLAETSKKKTAEWEASKPNVPLSIPCPRCAIVLHLDSAASDNHWRAVYLDCQPCAAKDASTARRKALLSAGIPSDALHATLDNFRTDRTGIKPAWDPPQAFLDAAKKFVDGDCRNLILAGTPGIGKGHLAAATAIYCQDEHKMSFHWTTCSTLFGDYHRAYATDSTTDIIRECASPGLFILDEICLRVLPADGEEILFEIFESRHKRQVPSLLLGNKLAEEVRSWLGSRITDRLRSGGCLFRYGEWDSMRGSNMDGATGDF